MEKFRNTMHLETIWSDKHATGNINQSAISWQNILRMALCITGKYQRSKHVPPLSVLPNTSQDWFQKILWKQINITLIHLISVPHLHIANVLCSSIHGKHWQAYVVSTRGELDGMIPSASVSCCLSIAYSRTRELPFILCLSTSHSA